MPSVIPFIPPTDHVGKFAFTSSQRLKALAVRTMFHIPADGFDEEPTLHEYYQNIWRQLYMKEPISDGDNLAALWLMEIFFMDKSHDGEMVGEYLQIFYMLQQGFK